MKNKSIEEIEGKPLSDADIRSYLGRGTKTRDKDKTKTRRIHE